MSDLAEEEPIKTCMGQQADGSCQSVVLPECEDRNVYCSELPDHTNLADVLEPDRYWKGQGADPTTNPNKNRIMGVQLQYKCGSSGYYFDYALPDPFISFHSDYTTNIKQAIFTCNNYG